MSGLNRKLNNLLAFLDITDNHVPIYVYHFAARMLYGWVTAIKQKDPTVPMYDDAS